MGFSCLYSLLVMMLISCTRKETLLMWILLKLDFEFESEQMFLISRCETEKVLAAVASGLGS